MKNIVNTCVITITDSISPTSMPYNEFVLYRRKHYHNEKQIVIVLFEKEINTKVEYFDDIEIFRVGNGLFKMRKTILDIVSACTKNNLRYVFHIHEGKSVIFFNIATMGKYRDKVIYTLHSTYSHYQFHNKLFARMATYGCYRLVCVSKTSYKYFPDYLKRHFDNKITYIQNGVDTDRVENVLENYHELEKQKQFSLVYVARLVQLKRHEILFDAISDINGVKLVLIGKGPREEELKKIAEEKNISDKIVWCGGVSREDVYIKIADSDLYVSSSEYEGLPISVLEAMCCAKPCLVSNIEQHLEIQNMCSSLVLVEDDVNEWKSKIKYFKSLSREKLKVIGFNNKMDVRNKFSLKKMHKKYDAIYFNN